MLVLIICSLLRSLSGFCTDDGWALGEGADFEALNCQPSTKVDTRQDVLLTTELPFLPNACYQP